MEVQNQHTSSDGTREAHNENAYRRLIEVGIALSAEKDHQRLMENILCGGKRFYTRRRRHPLFKDRAEQPQF